MKLKLVRTQCGEKATLGKLYINDVLECLTLEDPDRCLESGGVKIKGDTAIQRGTFEVIIDHSNRFNKDLPHILNVPQYEGVRIHPGNSSIDTEGCILLGKEIINDNFISNSKKAFDAFYQKLQTALNDGESVTIEII